MAVEPKKWAHSHHSATIDILTVEFWFLEDFDFSYEDVMQWIYRLATLLNVFTNTVGDAAMEREMEGGLGDCDPAVFSHHPVLTVY